MPSDVTSDDEEDTDWDDESIPDRPREPSALGNEVAKLTPHTSGGSIMSEQREIIVQSLMQDFWRTFEKRYISSRPAKITSTSTTPSVTSAPVDVTSSRNPKPGSSTKHPRDEEGDDNTDRDGEAPPQKKPTGDNDAGNDGKQLACPYRKKNPVKYCQNDKNWKLCATKDFKSIARLKYVKITEVYNYNY